MDVTAYTSPADAALMGKTILLGLGVVFVGLVCIIALCFVMGRLVRAFAGKKTAPAAPAAPVVTEDRGALSAVIAAAIAEDLGTDIGGIRIVSIKKL